MIANLMMYARPQLSTAHARFWQLIRGFLAEVGIESPDTLTQDAEEFSVWRDPELVLSQTCGMPYRLFLSDDVELVGTPDYGLAGCAAGYYRSALIVRADDERTDITTFRNATFAFNQTISQSGFAAPYWHMKPLGIWFENRMQTHQHVASARAVADGKADIAALDAVTWRNLKTYEPFAAQLRVLDWTAPTPGLPLITAKRRDGAMICAAVAKAIGVLDTGDREALGIKGIVRIPKEAYLAVPNPPEGSGFLAHGPQAG